jgi:hypothetical protein
MSDTTNHLATHNRDWIAPAVNRQEPALETDERWAVEDWLAFHHDTLLSK